MGEKIVVKVGNAKDRFKPIKEGVWIKARIESITPGEFNGFDNLNWKFKLTEKEFNKRVMWRNTNTYVDSDKGNDLYSFIVGMQGHVKEDDEIDISSYVGQPCYVKVGKFKNQKTDKQHIMEIKCIDEDDEEVQKEELNDLGDERKEEVEKKEEKKEDDFIEGLEKDKKELQETSKEEDDIDDFDLDDV